jgi:hypothetical protein
MFALSHDQVLAKMLSARATWSQRLSLEKAKTIIEPKEESIRATLIEQ